MAIKPPVEKHARRSKRFEMDPEVKSEVCCYQVCLLVLVEIKMFDTHVKLYANKSVNLIYQGNVKVKEELKDDDGNTELKRLQFYGAGPKMAGYNVGKKDNKPRSKLVNYDYDPVSTSFSLHLKILICLFVAG